MEILLLFPAFIGIGWLVVRQSPIFLAFWIGASVVIVFLPLWHLIAPIDSFTLTSIIGIGAISWLLKLYRHESIRFERLSIWLVLIVIPLIIYRLINPTYNYDDGLYHLQIMSWYRQYPVVPGLANLHGRFGFNSSFYLLSALAGQWTMPLLFVGFAGFIGETPARRLASWFVPPLLLMGWVGYSNDLALLLFGTISVSQLWLVIEKHQLSSSTFLLLATLPMLKLSAAPLAVGCLLLLVYPISRQKLVLIFLGAGLILPYVVHGIILSGYPLYPLKLFGLPVEWRVPDTLIEADAMWIYSWARIPGAPLSETINTWGWVGQWMERQSTEPLFIFALSVFMFLLLIIVVTRKKLRLSWRGIMLLPAIAALAYWFITAPDVRFAALPLWTLVGVAVTLTTEYRHRIERTLYGFVMVLSALVAIVNFGQGARLSVPALTTFVIKDGRVVYTPVQPSDQCWSAPLPCAAYVNSNLRQRGGTLGSGFTLESYESQTVPSE